MPRTLKQQLKTIVAILAVVLCAVVPTSAQSEQKTRILFIGNSYTYFNNLPVILTQLAASAKPPKNVEAEMFVEGGATLQKLWDGGQALAKLRQGHWDYVVLQEQSTLGNAGMVNGVPRINDPANFFKYARLFDAEIKKAGARTVFYMTWARQNSPESQQKLTEAYATIAQELNAVLAPVGVAWQLALTKDKKLILHQADKSHPNAAGSYLAACVLYAAIFQQSPVGLTARVSGKPVDFSGQVFNTESQGVFSSATDVVLVNLDEVQTRNLQETAWQTSELGKALTSTRPWQKHYSLMLQGDYLGAVRGLKADLQNPESEDEKQTILQFLAWVLNAVGSYDEAQQAFNQAVGAHEVTTPSSQEVTAIRQTPLTPAEEVVLTAAKKHQIVILNEAHHQPEGRAFGARLMTRLKAAGVSYLAIETGRQEPLDEAAKTGRVTLDTDVYTFDPQRAELLRAAIAAGLKPVAIDMRADEQQNQPKDMQGGIAARDTAMAKHVAEILSGDPSAKILVWAGFSHACKVPQGRQGTEWMAARLWKLTGIEPYSIYQMSDAIDAVHDDTIYRLVVADAARRMDRPVAVRLPIDTLAGAIPDHVRRNPVYAEMLKMGVDAVVIHPPKSAAKNGRPAWLDAAASVKISGRVECGQSPCEGYLVQVLPGEDQLNAPADQVLSDAQGRFDLRVRPGRYTLRVWRPGARPEDNKVAVTLPAEGYSAGQKVPKNIAIPTT